MPLSAAGQFVMKASEVEVLQEKGGPYRVEHQNLGHGHSIIGWHRFRHAGLKPSHARVVTGEDSRGQRWQYSECQSPKALEEMGALLRL